ncbi:hypothetical protein KAR91_49270 [Candidatus Pacearchaeota archaeon]|nr:hypothetical protein [Candidatus Pacearchaeota archaeon]
MKKITYINHEGNKRAVECEEFAIGVQHHDGCQLTFLGDLVSRETNEREIVHQVYGVKEWWVEDV